MVAKLYEADRNTLNLRVYERSFQTEKDGKDHRYYAKS